MSALSDDALIDLVNAANYMDLKILLDVTCATIAAKFRGKTVEELSKQYNITEPFTPEEEERLKAENPWAVSGDEERIMCARATKK
jgi:S-phase kinase-associated protein 1